MPLDAQPYDSAVQHAETTFLAELERVVRGERTTVDPLALLFVAAEVILEGRKADEHASTGTLSCRAGSISKPQ